MDFDYFDYTIRMLRKQKEEVKRLIHSVMTEDIEVPELRMAARYLDRGVERLEEIRRRRIEAKKQKEEKKLQEVRKY